MEGDGDGWIWHELPDGRRFSVKRRGKALSEYMVKRVLLLEKEGLPRVVIAERLGVCTLTIRKYLNLAGRVMMNRGARALKVMREAGGEDGMPGGRRK